jgi:hypothetical protein
MSEPEAGQDGTFDDIAPFAVVEAIVATVASLAPDIPDEDAAWDAYIATKGPEYREYFNTIRRS